MINVCDLSWSEIWDCAHFWVRQIWIGYTEHTASPHTNRLVLQVDWECYFYNGHVPILHMKIYPHVLDCIPSRLPPFNYTLSLWMPPNLRDKQQCPSTGAAARAGVCSRHGDSGRAAPTHAPPPVWDLGEGYSTSDAATGTMLETLPSLELAGRVGDREWQEMDLKKKKKKTHTSSVSMICSVNVIYTLCTESFNMRQYTIVNKNIFVLHTQGNPSDVFMQSAGFATNMLMRKLSEV